MRTALDLLNDIEIASPCPASWYEMDGDDRVRSCSICRKNVYNLSAMTADEAAGLLEEHHGPLCVRLYRRADGKVITDDCPEGLAARARKRVLWYASLAAGWIGISSLLTYLWAAEKYGWWTPRSTTVMGGIPMRPAWKGTGSAGSLPPINEDINGDDHEKK